ncbi:XK-related protein 6 [Aplysia californica]|uniref:XK-related protein n=1 Tax=Aplysia californica TaxID=6500 RepID=A0ABM1VVK0_APLCA|nr:XK-related protein 6 [Aplysia californica]
MAKSYINIIDVSVTVLSLLTFLLDVSTDLVVCVQLLSQGHVVWGGMMVASVSVPALMMSVFSLTWHYHDASLRPAVLATHLLLLAPVERYVHAIYLGFKSRLSKKVVHTQRALTAQSDVSILRLFESFLESAPQLVLQLYIMVTLHRLAWFTGLSAVCSLLSLTWAMTAYTDAQRRAHKSVYERRPARLALHWAWQLFMTWSRIAAFVAFTAALNYWVLVVMGFHWLIAFIWISVRGTDFGSSFCEKWLFRAVCGFIYIFVFLNLNDGKSRWRVSTYYTLVFLENAAMVVVFLTLGNGADLIVVTCLSVFGGFVLDGHCLNEKIL